MSVQNAPSERAFHRYRRRLRSGRGVMVAEACNGRNGRPTCAVMPPRSVLGAPPPSASSSSTRVGGCSRRHLPRVAWTACRITRGSWQKRISGSRYTHGRSTALSSSSAYPSAEAPACARHVLAATEGCGHARDHPGRIPQAALSRLRSVWPSGSWSPTLIARRLRRTADAARAMGPATSRVRARGGFPG